jgi:thioesterase domain-containing protein/acyl carrier protein
LRALSVSAGREPAAVTPRDRLELSLRAIWEDLLEVGEVGVRDSFFDLGGHSLLAVRLMARLESVLGVRLPLGLLFRAPTIEALAAVLRQKTLAPAASPLVPLQLQGSRPPFFCVHPSHGDALCYLDLSRRLGADQPFYAFQARGIDGETPAAATIESLAADYLQELSSLQEKGPYRLGGWSLGGVIAFEMARQLEARGEEVALLALLDSQALPRPRGLAPEDEPLLLRMFARDLGLALRDGGERLPLQQALDGLLDDARESLLLPPDLSGEVFRHRFEVFRCNVQALWTYQPHPIRSRITLLRAADSPVAQGGDPTLGWESLAGGGIDLFLVPGDHYTMIREPNVPILAQQLAAQIDKRS